MTLLIVILTLLPAKDSTFFNKFGDTITITKNNKDTTIGFVAPPYFYFMKTSQLYNITGVIRNETANDKFWKEFAYVKHGEKVKVKRKEKKVK